MNTRARLDQLEQAVGTGHGDSCGWDLRRLSDAELGWLERNYASAFAGTLGDADARELNRLEAICTGGPAL